MNEIRSCLCLIPNLGKYYGYQLSVVTQSGKSVWMQTVGECRKASYLRKICSSKTSAARFKGFFWLIEYSYTVVVLAPTKKCFATPKNEFLLKATSLRTYEGYSHVDIATLTTAKTHVHRKLLYVHIYCGCFNN
ncbi:hypothetical protein GQX74_015358 [Glossina fuscipes]|nr:hypothetical protein GQX74_015358 [Glossina fuscipes]